MTRAHALLRLSGMLLLTAAVSAQATRTFVPPRLVSGAAPGLPAGTTVGGGEVVIEAIVDQDGALTRPILARSTAPFSQLVMEAISTWRFTPARAAEPGVASRTVSAPVVIAAEYRPPTLMGPTLGETPRDIGTTSSDAAYPVAMAAATYPPQALAGGVVIFEVGLDTTGQIIDVRTIRADPGFEASARDALLQWKFRGGAFQGQAAPSTVYAVFGFSQPVTAPTR